MRKHTCLYCKIEYEYPKEKSTYCSNTCRVAHGRVGVQFEKDCGNTSCSEVFKLKSKSDKRQFCSHSCAATVNNSKYPKRSGDIKDCKKCNTRLKKTDAVFCSRDCFNAFNYDTYISNWLKGTESGTTKHGPSDRVRRWVKELYGLFCWECGWCKPHPDTGIPPLQIDHIDGDAMNNRPENLRLLCGGCHTLTPTYGSRGGRKSTRTYRYNKR